MTKKLFTLLLSFYIVILNPFNVFADIPQEGIIGEMKYDSTSTYLTNISLYGDFSKYNKTGLSPNGYIATTSSNFSYYSTSNISIENIKMVSFWYNYYNTSGEIFNNNDLILKTISSTQVQVLYKGEQIGIMNLSGWNLLSMYIDSTNKKLKIFINGNQSSYSFSINRSNLIESTSNTIKYCYLSSLRIYNRILNESELNDIYNEKNNTQKPILSQGTGTLNFNTSVDNLDLSLGNINDTNTGSIYLYYSINGSSFLPLEGVIYNSPINQIINFSLPENKFYYGPNNLQLKAYDGYEYSNITTYTINKNFFAEPDVSKSTLLGSFHFKGNLLSETGSSYFTGSSFSYTATGSFPNRYITIGSESYNVYLNSTTSNIETLSFWYKGDGELFNNNYISLLYNSSTGFYPIKSGTVLFYIGPKNDTNWHLITLQLDKNDDKLYINIDGGKYINSLAYYKDSLYYSSDGVNGLKFKKGSFAFVKTYSSKLSDSEILSLYNFYKNTISSIVSSSTGYTLKSTDEYINIPLIVNDDDLNQNIEYYYSLDSINYTKFDGLSSQTPISSGTINLTLSGSIFNNGLNNLYLKANDGKSDGNILMLSVTKNINNINITIDESGLYQIINKNIKASISVGNLFYATTKDNICDDTLSFLPYEDLYFSNELDNGTRVCYKGVYGEETIYKISGEVSGIGSNTIGIKNSDLFYNYTSWKKGSTLKDFDPIYIMISSQVSTSVQGTSTTKSYPKLITDVNGDGLPDLLITNYELYASYYGNEYKYYYALLINKGNMDYDLTYRCVNISGRNTSNNGYYGDCVK